MAELEISDHPRNVSTSVTVVRDHLPRKKILVCYANVRLGGCGRHVVTEVNGLQERGHDVRLVLQEDQGEYLSEVSPQVPVYGLGYKGIYSYFRMFWKLIPLVARINPQVIASHSWPVDILISLASLYLRPRPRVVFFRHSLNITDPARGKLRSYVLRSMMRQCYSRADAIVAVSPGVKEVITEVLGTSAERIFVIPNLWDLNRTISGAREQPDDPWFGSSETAIPIVLSCATLTWEKDLAMLLRAFALVRERRCARLAIVGEGPLRSTLSRLAEELGIAKDFRLLGYQSNPAQYVTRATVFALSSIYESFGNVLVEALLLGVPVVATNVSGPSFVLDGGRYGLLVPPGDERAMAASILRLLDDQSLRARLIKTSPQRARAFAPDRILDQIERLLLGLDIESVY